MGILLGGRHDQQLWIEPVAVLEALQGGGFDALEAKGAELESLLKPVLEPYPVTLVRQGSIFWLAFQQPAPRAWGAVDRSGADRYKILHRAMLERGVYMAPSAYEVGFVSAAHETAHLQHTAKAMGEALALAFQETQ